MTTKRDIGHWLIEALRKGCTHLVVGSGHFEYEDYPVYVMPGTSAQAEVSRIQRQEMSSVREVYDLSMDIDTQLKEPRAWHI